MVPETEDERIGQRERKMMTKKTGRGVIMYHYYPMLNTLYLTGHCWRTEGLFVCVSIWRQL